MLLQSLLVPQIFLCEGNQILLRKWRFIIFGLAASQEAVQRFKSDINSYCLVLSECRHYLEYKSQEKSDANTNVKVILMTAFQIKDNEFSKVFPSASVKGFVQMPISIKDLTGKILSLIGETKRRMNEN